MILLEMQTPLLAWFAEMDIESILHAWGTAHSFGNARIEERKLASPIHETLVNSSILYPTMLSFNNIQKV